ncbi:unnamed protein product [Heligmosomoides polygyrus]|uniref:PITH domain-containing protein n=1 Tax=Heligmosomoides polygyrus TaxID=6339 RepID=A0A3P8A2G5_HELPZ|nr:unnamed protein product [Heligmosomoides polygyrus]
MYAATGRTTALQIFDFKRSGISIAENASQRAHFDQAALTPEFASTISQTLLLILVQNAPNDHTKLFLSFEFTFIFESEHYVISIKQRPRDCLLKISYDGIHDDKRSGEVQNPDVPRQRWETPSRFQLQLELDSLDKSREFAATL